MEKTKQLYEIISDLWTFSHKYSDLIESNESINWESFVDEYSDIADKRSNDDEMLKQLRCNLFVQIFKYFRDRENEKHSE